MQCSNQMILFYWRPFDLLALTFLVLPTRSTLKLPAFSNAPYLGISYWQENVLFDYCIIIITYWKVWIFFVFINEWHKSMVSSDALIGTSEYPALQTKCCLSRWRSNSVRPYTKRLKLQTNEEYTVNYRSISQTKCRSDRKCDWRYVTPKCSTPEHTKYLIYTLHFNCKGNVLRMVLLWLLHLAKMSRSDIWEECTVQLYWVTEYGVGGWGIWKENVLCQSKLWKFVESI